MSHAQVFCSVNDLVEDQQSAGASETRWYQALRDASDYVQKEIGWFLPVTEQRVFNGKGQARLFVPALLSVTSIVNDEDTLTTGDYLLNPSGKHWADGPYSWLAVDPDADNLSEWMDEEAGVVITGKWGMYEKSALTGATVASNQAAADLTLVVSDGGKVSPGMVLLIGTEQLLITGWSTPTTNVTTCSAAVTASDQVLTLANGALVKIGEIIRVEFEQMKVRDIRTNSVSVIRGWNGSGIGAHAISSQVDVYRTVSVERAVNGTTAAAHASTTAISRYLAPDDIQFLTRQIATLMLNKSKSGYQGRTGSAETGVVFYNDAFPRDDLKRIKSNYYIPRAR